MGVGGVERGQPWQAAPEPDDWDGERTVHAPTGSVSTPGASTPRSASSAWSPPVRLPPGDPRAVSFPGRAAPPPGPSAAYPAPGAASAAYAHQGAPPGYHTPVPPPPPPSPPSPYGPPSQYYAPPAGYAPQGPPPGHPVYGPPGHLPPASYAPPGPMPMPAYPPPDGFAPPGYAAPGTGSGGGSGSWAPPEAAGERTYVDAVDWRLPQIPWAGAAIPPGASARVADLEASYGRVAEPTPAAAPAPKPKRGVADRIARALAEGDEKALAGAVGTLVQPLPSGGGASASEARGRFNRALKRLAEAGRLRELATTLKELDETSRRGRPGVVVYGLYQKLEDAVRRSGNPEAKAHWRRATGAA